MIMPTLTKLLAINMMANKFFGLSNKPTAICEVLSVSFPNSSKSVGVKEKNATSDPEIIADINNSTISIKDPTISGIINSD